MDLDILESREEPGREESARNPYRLQIDAQVAVIQRQIGGLEQVREKLGLSRRKMAQLLLVDPSAWTRWTKDSNSAAAPPHIYRALQWYLSLQEKIPGLTPQYFIGKDPEVLHQAALKRIQSESTKRQEFEEALATQNLRLEEQMGRLQSENKQLQQVIRSHRWNFILLTILGGFLVALSAWSFLR